MFDRLRAFWSKGAKPSNGNANTSALDKEQGTTAAIGLKQQADKYLEDGDVAGAMPFYEQAIEIDPHNVSALVKAGFCLRELGREAEAEQLIRRALALAPNSSEAHYLLSTVVRARGELNQAIDELFNTLRCDAEFEIAYHELFFMLYQCERIDDAKQVAQSGLARFPDSAELHFYLGNAFHAEKQLGVGGIEFSFGIVIGTGPRLGLCQYEFGTTRNWSR